MTLMRAAGIAACVALGTGLVAAFVWGREPAEMVIVPAGTTFVAMFEQDLSAAVSQPGDEFELRTVRPVRLDGGMEIPAGSLITGEVADPEDDDEGKDSPGISVRFTELVFDGDSTEIEIETEQFRFGTLSPQAPTEPIVVPAGRKLAIRLTHPVAVAYRPAPEPIRAAE